MAKISGHVRHGKKWQNLAKLNKDIKCNVAHIGKTDKNI